MTNTGIEMHDVRLYDGMTARVPVGTILVKAYFDGWYQVMRCFVPRQGGYNAKEDAKRYMSELRILGVSVFLEMEEVYPAPKYEDVQMTDEEVIPKELTDCADEILY